MTSAIRRIANKASEIEFNEVGMSHRFVVAIDSGRYDLGSWSKVSGLNVTWSVCTHRPGDGNEVWICPGATRYPNIRLSRAACSDSQIVQQWLCDTSRAHQPLSGSVKMLDWSLETVVEWKLKQFFPVGWAISDFESTGARPAVETLDLAHTGFLDDEIAFRGDKA
jgi:phage tail-like protein